MSIYFQMHMHQMRHDISPIFPCLSHWKTLIQFNSHSKTILPLLFPDMRYNTVESDVLLKRPSVCRAALMAMWSPLTPVTHFSVSTLQKMTGCPSATSLSAIMTSNCPAEWARLWMSSCVCVCVCVCSISLWMQWEYFQIFITCKSSLTSGTF